MASEQITKLFAAIGNAFNFHYQLDGKDSAKKEDLLRVTAVLQKVLKQDRVEEETKERAKAWHARMAEDAAVKKMFRESTNEGIEAFFLMDEPQQHAALETVPVPLLNQLYAHLRTLQPTISADTWALLQTRLARREFRWTDVWWIGIALVIVIMVMRA